MTCDSVDTQRVQQHGADIQYSNTHIHNNITAKYNMYDAQRVQRHGIDIQYLAHSDARGGIDDDEILEQEDPGELAALQETN